MDYDYSLTNKPNLTKLRDYLASLPDDYENFEMKRFAENHAKAANANPETGCGTPACMVGHGPAAGIPIEHDRVIEFGSLYWDIYSIDKLISCDYLWMFAFDGSWPSSLPEAITRLTMVIEERVPDTWDYDDRFADMVEAA